MLPKHNVTLEEYTFFCYNNVGITTAACGREKSLFFLSGEIVYLFFFARTKRKQKWNILTQ